MQATDRVDQAAKMLRSNHWMQLYMQAAEEVRRSAVKSQKKLNEKLVQLGKIVDAHNTHCALYLSYMGIYLADSNIQARSGR